MHSTNHSPNQFALLRQRRFAPFFWTQFLGAANDNLFKFALTVMLTYQLNISWLPPQYAGLVIGAVFIAPFLLASATSGQLTDKWDKTRMIRMVKNLELAIMLLASVGFYVENVPLLLSCIFLLGLHSTLFGPVKFAYLPHVLTPREMTGGNGMVEMGTFVAILLGNVAGGMLIAIPQNGTFWVAASCLALAAIGRLTAQAVPPCPTLAPELLINWNPFTETLRNLRLAHAHLAVFRSLLGISWMWFLGAIFLSQLPSFSKEVLYGDAAVASLLLVVFSVGIGMGSLLCEVLSKRHVEIGLVPLGAIGMSVFAIDLYFAIHAIPSEAVFHRLAGASNGLSTSQFLAMPHHWRVLVDLGLLALSAGLYSVPMYTLIQLRSPATHRARIMAANNILNALFMIASSVLAGIALALGMSVPELFLAVGLLNIAVALYVFLLVPEYLLRFVAWVVSHLMYRFHIHSTPHTPALAPTFAPEPQTPPNPPTNHPADIPETGAAVLVCNHVSYVDAVLLMAASPRPIRFLMDYRIFNIPVLGWFFRLGKAIPIATQEENPHIYQAAFDAAHQVLQEGELLAIFPEGFITRDGQLQPFKMGVFKILQRAHNDNLVVPIVPMALSNLWGSFFSRFGGRAMSRPFRRGVWSRIGLHIGAPIAYSPSLSPKDLEQTVQTLLESTT